MADLHVVVYQDRASDLVGLKLVLLSLAEHCSDLPVTAFAPGAGPEFVRWQEQHLPNVNLVLNKVEGRSGFNVKADCLMTVLNREPTKRAVWIDSDIIVTRDFGPTISAFDRAVFSATEEVISMNYQGGNWRSKEWNLTPARDFGVTINSCVLSATSQHIAFLEAWQRYMGDPFYVGLQARPVGERPPYMMTDQDVLNALLESSEFASIPVHLLRRGWEVAHCFDWTGYVPHEILHNIVTGHRPFFVHAAGEKPWRPNVQFKTHHETSPYTLTALRYQDRLGEPTPWMDAQTTTGKNLRQLFGSNPQTTYLLYATAREMRVRVYLKTLAKRMQGKP